MIVRELFAKLGLEVDEGAFNAAEKAIGALKGGLVQVGAAAAAAALGLAALVKSTADAGGEVAKAAQRVGVSTDALQELRFAAGSTSEALEHGLAILAKNAFNAANGSVEAAVAFRQVGVSVRTAGGQLKAPDELLGDLAEKFAEMPDGIRKVALAQELFGKSGAGLIPFLNKGRDGIDSLREEARELGIVLDQNTIAQAKEFGKALHFTEAAVKGLGYAIGGPLIAVVTPLIKAIGDWIAQHRVLIAQKVDGVVRAIAGALRFLWIILGPAVKMLGALATNATVAKLAMVALGGAMVLQLGRAALSLLPALASVVAQIQAVGLWSTISAAIGAAAPYAIAAAWLALGALIFLIFEDLYTYLTGGESLAGDFADYLWQTLPKVFEAIERKIEELWHAAGDALRTAIDFYRDLFSSFWRWILNSVAGLGERIADAFKSGARSLVEMLPGGAALSPQLFGGGASPASSVDQSVSRTVVGGPRLSIGDINVTVPPGADGERVGQDVHNAIEERLQTMLRETAAAFPAGG